MSVAAVDLGTNSLRLLILDDAGAVVARENRIVRLGEGVDATGLILPAALERVANALDEYRELTRRAGVSRLRMVATSAARGARNPDALRAVVTEHLGVPLEIVDGEQEARLSFLGATRSPRVNVGGDVLVVDLGGGSTELVRGRGEVAASRSVDIGSVRLTERVLAGDPPTPAERRHAVVVIDEALDDAFAAVPVAGLDAVVGVAGTVTTVTALALGLKRYDASRIDGATVPIAVARQACETLVGTTVARRVELGIPPGRADVIGAGALIWDRVLNRVAAEAGLTSTITSEADILDGVAREIHPRSDPPL